jgi:ferric-dicitrate binding protein FerR (iron transport regulator)
MEKFPDTETLEAYLADELSPQETARIEALLKSDSAAARRLLELAREEVVIAEWARVADKTVAMETDAERRRLRFSFGKPGMPRFLAAAAVIVALGATLWYSRSDAPVSYMAKLEQAGGEVRIVTAADSRPAESGLHLKPGDGLELLGENASAVVVYPDGTRLEFDGDAVVTEFSEAAASGSATAGKRVVIASGNVRAEVAKQPAGAPMRLKTGNAEVVVLGTRFHLSGGSDATFVETTEGAVRLVRTRDGRSIEVPAGFEAAADIAPELTATLSPPRFTRPRWTGKGNHRTTGLTADGRTLVTTEFRSGRVTLRNAADGGERMTFAAHAGNIEVAALSPDGTLLATSGDERNLKLWRLGGAMLISTIDAEGPLQGVGFAADGETVYALIGHPQNGMELHAWDVSTGEPAAMPVPIRGEAWSFSSSGRLLAITSARDHTAVVVDLATGQRQVVVAKLPARAVCVGISPDDTRLAVADIQGHVEIHDISAGKLQQSFQVPDGAVQGLTFSPDGRHLAMGLRFGTVRMWDLASGKQLYVLAGPTRPGSTASIRPMFFTPDQKTLATTESLDDSTVRLWDLP